ncbi:MAG: hypothetical protein JO057_25720 [Chloroflexi bacterium]|nr:hypothetical protein [Chloroflexota bacterium]MBV9750538.1 hypothetical protein [Acetobacteraceae bacterium]
MTSGSYEVRVLRCAAIYLMAFWVKADADGADSVYPMAPTPKGVQASREYSEADFMNAIRPLAQRRAEARGQTNSPLRSL